MSAYRRNDRVEFAPFEEEAILFNPDTRQFVKLNRTTSFIWKSLERAATPVELADAVCGAFRNVTPDRAQADINSALAEMSKLGLVIET